ncbi:AmmeMemoRadiSam system radical SAM enzyme [Spirochaetia bacterium]|nr:AmmeMemoRadiSam system radical SAM enzyme [Spirochaetia bacterium]
MRQNCGGPALPLYGHITALAADPIEKKPLYHFRPGSSILSIGFVGCNLHCPFCQNWHISQRLDADYRELAPEAVIAAARKGGFRQIAYTYSEPLVHAEYLLDCMARSRKAGIANVLVSNGCVNAAAATDILALTDAANIDLKCFSEATYSRILGGDLKTVLAFIRSAHAAGVHLEVTTLIVPALNDGEEEMEAAGEFIAGVAEDIPWHLSAYHPDYQWDAPPTDPVRLREIARRARRKLRYVYTGNIRAVPGEEGTGDQDTHCPECGAVLVGRRGYQITTGGLELFERDGAQIYRCRHCGKPAPVRW